MKLLILSDIHGNWPALRAVLEAETDADRDSLPRRFGQLWPAANRMCGLGQGDSPANRVIQGNHDRAVSAGGDPHCSPLYASLADATQPLSAHLLNPDLKRFLRELQPLHRFELAGAKSVACHAIPRDPLYGYLPERAAATLWESEIVTAGLPDFLFLGHTHVPMRTRLTKTLIVNPGSVGLPQDGNPQAAYAVWADGAVSLRRTAYDVEETIGAYDKLGLAPHILNQLAMLLRSGCGLSLERSGAQVHPARKP